jgi:hypothetical protein
MHPPGMKTIPMQKTLAVAGFIEMLTLVMGNLHGDVARGQ